MDDEKPQQIRFWRRPSQAETTAQTTAKRDRREESQAGGRQDHAEVTSQVAEKGQSSQAKGEKAAQAHQETRQAIVYDRKDGAARHARDKDTPGQNHGVGKAAAPNHHKRRDGSLEKIR